MANYQKNSSINQIPTLNFFSIKLPVVLNKMKTVKAHRINMFLNNLNKKLETGKETEIKKSTFVADKAIVIKLTRAMEGNILFGILRRPLRSNE